jgi:hypothetical protein
MRSHFIELFRLTVRHAFISISSFGVIKLRHTHTDVRGCIQKFPDWPPGARTANCTALCHQVQLYRYFVSQSSKFWSHNCFCCFRTSVYRLSPEKFGYTLVCSVHASFRKPSSQIIQSCCIYPNELELLCWLERAIRRDEGVCERRLLEEKEARRLGGTITPISHSWIRTQKRREDMAN